MRLRRGKKLVPPKRKKKKPKDKPRPSQKVDTGLDKNNSNESWVEVVKRKRGKPQPQTSFFPSSNSDKGERTSLRLREQDWPGMVLVQNANMLGTLIDRKGISNKFIVLIRNDKELDEVVGIAQGDKKLQLILLMPCQKNIKDLKQKQDFTLEQTKFPFVDMEGKLVTLKVAVWRNCNLQDTGAVRIVIPSDKIPKNQGIEKLRAETTVFRLTADVRFCTTAAWQKLQNQPGTFARKWCQGVSPDAASNLMDTWSWEMQPGSKGNNSVIKGLIRVKKGVPIGNLLTASGRSFEGLRIFIDPLDRNSTPDEAWGKKPYITWVEQEKRENDSDYATRVARIAANGGVARGWRQLGLRSKQQPSDQSLTKKQWVIRSAPREWEMEDIEEFLKAADFKDVEFNSKKRERYGVTWGFRACRTGEQTYLQLLNQGTEFGQDNFVVVERLFRTFNPQTVTKLRGEQRVHINKPAGSTFENYDDTNESQGEEAPCAHSA